MKKILYICFFIAVLSACQSAPNKNTNIITPTPNGVPSASASNQPMTVSGQKPINNPAHGQPYHDCAIPVGAPLGSKSTAPVTMPAVQQPANRNKEAKLNPPHGQPGHRCEIAVGAPLS